MLLANSSAQVSVQVDVSTTGTPLMLYSHSVATHLRTEVDEGTMGAKQVTHTFQTASLDVFRQTLLPMLQSSARRIRFRLGQQQGSTVVWRDWEQHRVMTCVPDVAGTSGSQQGFTFAMTSQDWLATGDLSSHTLARNGLVSAQVETIAAAYGLDTAVEPTANRYQLLQCHETDYRFTVDRLAPVATNTQGLGAYLFFLNGSQLHFHTAGWSAPTVWELPYNLGRGSPTNLQFRDQVAVLSDGSGGAGVRTTAWDPVAGAASKATTSPALAKRLSALLPTTTGLASFNRHVGQNQLRLELAEAQVEYERARQSYYRLEFVVANQPLLRPGDLVRVTLADPADPLGGLWLVSALHGVVTGTSGLTRAVCTRGELNGVTNAFPGLQALDATAQLTAPQVAPGIPLNVPAAQVSSVAQGEGDTTDSAGGSIVTVQPAG